MLTIGLLVEQLIQPLLLSGLQGHPHLSTCWTLLKLTFILWCLAPITYNGSDVTFDYVLAPLVPLAKYGVDFCMDLSLKATQFLLDITPIIINTSLETGTRVLETAAWRLEALVQLWKVGGEYCRDLSLQAGEYMSRTAPIIATAMEAGGKVIEDSSEYLITAAEGMYSGIEIVTEIIKDRTRQFVIYSGEVISDGYCATVEFIIRGLKEAKEFLKNFVSCVEKSISKLCELIMNLTLAGWRTFQDWFKMFAPLKEQDQGHRWLFFELFLSATVNL